MGVSGCGLVVIVAAVILALGSWLFLPHTKRISLSGPVAQLVFLAALFAAAFVLTGPEFSGGEFATWYEGLAWSFNDEVSYFQFAMALACGLYALAAANRLVSLVLEAAGTPREKGEQKLKGGRLLGPMERPIVAGMILAGDPAGAAIIFAAKGLLRLPNFRDSSLEASTRPGSGADPITKPDGDQWTVAEYTEYFLVGTFASLLVAAALALAILATA